MALDIWSQMRDVTSAKLVPLLVWALTAPCCAGYTAGMRPDDKYNPSSSYLYGRFVVDAKSAPLSFASSESIGFTIRCRDGKTYTIGFSNQTALQIIKVAPSACQIDEIVYCDSDGIVRGRGMAPFRLLRNEFLDAGGVYYVGDFFAEASTESSSSQKFLYKEHRTTWRWEFTGVKNDYAKTTGDMKASFTGFATVPTEDRMPRR